jgi:uncharacterized membrane protein YeaQ/YmgE (transglycosylase-associated protein family)
LGPRPSDSEDAMDSMGLCGWIVFGFLAGLVARAIMPGRQNMGLIATTLLGVAGAFAGGFVVDLLRGGPMFRLAPAGFIGAVVGSLVLLLIGGALARR